MSILFVSEFQILLEIGNASRIFNIKKALDKFGIYTKIIPKIDNKNKFPWGLNRMQK